MTLSFSQTAHANGRMTVIATTTLNKIRAERPCNDGWTKLLKRLGKIAPDDDTLTLQAILDSNGLDDALWCLRASDASEFEMRRFARLAALEVVHLWDAPLIVLEYLKTGDEEKRDAARDAASAAARDAAFAAARDAVWDAAWDAWDARAAASAAARDVAWDAASAAARDAASAAARDVASAAARDAVWKIQTERFAEMFCTGE